MNRDREGGPNPAEMGMGIKPEDREDINKVANSIDKLEQAQQNDDPEAVVEATIEMEKNIDAIPQEGDSKEELDLKTRINGFLREFYMAMTGGEEMRNLAKDVAKDIKKALVGVGKADQADKLKTAWNGYKQIADKWGLPAAIKKLQGK